MRICYTIAMEQKYYKHKIENLIKVSKIVTVHYFEFAKDFQSKTESHDFWELVYADKHSVICTANENTITLNEGEMLFHKPNEKHSLAGDNQKAANVFIISFECTSAAMRFFENRQVVLPKDLLPYVYMLVEESKRYFDLPYADPNLKKMQPKASPSLGGTQLIKNMLEILLISVMRNHTEKPNAAELFLQQKDYEERLTRQIVTYLTAHVRERVSIDELCAYTSYNKSYLFRQFKAATKQTIMQYFTCLKVTEAKRLLRETDMNVTQIAEYLAFDSPNYFTKTFKKISGYTPLQYKKIRQLKQR